MTSSSIESSKTGRTIAGIASVAVAAGILEWPYAFYTLLRFGLCAASLFYLFGGGLDLEDWKKWALGGAAILYNPIVPVHLGDKRIWIVINVATVALFWIAATGRRRE